MDATRFEHAVRRRRERLAKLGQRSLAHAANPARTAPATPTPKDLEVPVIDRHTGRAVPMPKADPPSGHRANTCPRPPKVIVIPLAKPPARTRPTRTPRPRPAAVPPWTPPKL